MRLKSMLFSAILILTVFVHGCGTVKGKNPSEIESKAREFSLEMECIYNRMPMSTGGAYLIIAVHSSIILEENFKLINLVATGPNGVWETNKFDFNGFTGKGGKGFSNNARNFDMSIGTRFDVKLFIESESNKTEVLEIKNVETRIVE